MGRELVNKVKFFLHELYEEYKLLYPEIGSVEHPYEPNLVNEIDDDDDVSRTIISSSYLKKKRRKIIGEYKTEVDHYLMEPYEVDKPGFDILEYWKKNSDKYMIYLILLKILWLYPFLP